MKEAGHGRLLDFLLSSTHGRLIYVCTINAVVTSLTFLLVRIAKRSVDIRRNLRIILVPTALIVTNLAVLLLLLEYSSAIPEGLLSPTLLIISAVAIFIANTLALWMFHHMNAQNMKVIQLTATEQRIAMQAKHQEEIGQIEQELRKFRHDIHSHFQYLTMHLESGEIEKAEAYLRKLVVDLGELSMKINTGNPVLDAILSVKSHIASRDSIDFDVDAHLPEHLPISDNDLVIIAGNMLDNAIEASSCLPIEADRQVKVIGKIKNGVLLITVINAFTDVPEGKRIPWRTSKFKGKKRGLGLHIIMERVSQLIRQHDMNMLIVFVTNFRDYVFEGYEVSAFRYLIKPIKEKKVLDTLNAASEIYKRRQSGYFTIKKDDATYRIVKSDIIYFATENHYINAHTIQDRYTEYTFDVTDPSTPKWRLFFSVAWVGDLNEISVDNNNVQYHVEINAKTGEIIHVLEITPEMDITAFRY